MRGKFCNQALLFLRLFVCLFIYLLFIYLSTYLFHYFLFVYVRYLFIYLFFVYFFVDTYLFYFRFIYYIIHHFSGAPRGAFQQPVYNKCKVRWLRVLAIPLQAVHNVFLSETLSCALR